MQRNGFTLIELSIMLVISGLLVTTVVKAVNLVEQAKLRSVIVHFKEFNSSALVFKLAYNELPGDLSNADSFWSSCVDSGPNTCNGDGNGYIEISHNSQYEGMRVWQHLTLANILSGSYTGLGVSGGPNSSRLRGGINAPESPFNGGCYFFQRNANEGSHILSGTETGAHYCTNALFTPTQAYNIEMKVDGTFDPDSGNFRVETGDDVGANSCYTAGSPDIPNISNTDKACTLRWQLNASQNRS